MLLALAAFALAQSPLVVTTTPVAFPGSPWVDAAPADGTPDGWAVSAEQGGVSVVVEKGGAARFKWSGGTRASVCSQPVAVPAGQTVRLRSRVRGSATLTDVTALHLHLAGSTGQHHVARRRFDTGAFDWEAVDITATAPAGTDQAYACLEVQMLGADQAGSLELDPLQLELVRAESRLSRLPVRRILLLSIEAFRWDHVRANGYARSTTPNLDQLMAEGVSFDRHYAPAPYTHPSLASLVTGQLPTTLGFVDNIPSLGRSVPTLAELLGQAGYVTAAFNVQYVLSNRYGLNRGFHYYRNHPNDTGADVLGDEMIPFLQAHNDDNLFLWAHYFDPHGPYRPPTRYRTLFAGDPLWNADTMQVQRGVAAEGAPTVPKYIFDNGKTERRHYVASYDGDIAFTDAQLGRLMSFVRASNADDTLVIVTADHGESMTDHDRYFCHGSLYDHDLHVPMVVWGPGLVQGGVRTAAISSHVDVVPTVLDYAGVGSLPGFAGVDLRPHLVGGPAPERPHVVSVVGRAENLRYALNTPEGTKVLTDAAGRLIEAFDVLRDPGELTPLSDKKPARAIAKVFAATIKPPPKVKRQKLDDEDTERLRALGYLD